MEKYKTIVLVEKIKECLEQGKTQEALSIAEGIDKKKLKNLSDFGIIAECYFQNHDYAKAKEWFLKIYAKNPSRRILSQLVHLSIKLSDVQEAEKYLEEFSKVAPNDFYQYIFRYSIDKLNKMPLAKLIEDLVTLKRSEYIESWAYELAKLYHKAGLKERCIAECDDIILWFGNGEYVERAKTLRAYYLGELDVSAFQDSVPELTQESISDKTTDATELDESEGDGQDDHNATEPEEISADDEQEIDDAVNAVVDNLFDEIELESKAETSSESVEEWSKESKDVEGESELEQVSMQEPESISNVAIEADGTAVQEDDVEKELYRLLNEDEHPNNPKNEEIDATQEGPKQSIFDLKKKVEIKAMSNEQLVDESQERLFLMLEENDISLSENFGNFTRMEQVRCQIIRSLDQVIAQKSSNVNMILTGDSNSGKTDLAKCIAKTLFRMNRIGTSRVALIDGERLNSIALLEKKTQLQDCVLVIEHAGKMSKDTVAMLIELDKQLKGHLAMILEASREHMNRLLHANTSLNAVFNNRIHLNRYGIDDYMGFAYDYIVQNDYEIETEAYLALREAFTVFLKFKKGNALAELYTCLDIGMQKAEQRSKIVLREMTQRGRFGDNELMILKKEDLDFKF